MVFSGVLGYLGSYCFKNNMIPVTGRKPKGGMFINLMPISPLDSTVCDHDPF